MKRAKRFVYSLAFDDSGQDLIEYALLSALIGFACVAGMGTLASYINAAFSTIGLKVNNSIT
ncbi:MAG: hypothetical protein NVS9B15_16260 [Acidobacteriaceae bacterium]